jgi:hypothetical protein
MGLAASIWLIYYLVELGDPLTFRNLLQERITNLPFVTSMSLFLATVQVGMEGIVGLTLLLGVVLLIFGKEKAGLGLGSIGLLVYLVGANVIPVLY